MPVASGDYGAVLFDLDGTLVDTAPDMVSALQELQRQHGVDPVSYEYGRSHVSNGALGLLRIGFPALPDARREALLCDYVSRYAENLCVETAVFAGVDGLLDLLETGQCPWGVVTNKPAHLTEPLMAALQLSDRSAATVSGDTLPTKKPDPRPLFHACELAGIDPARTIYVGDAARDIEAGRRAGMLTIAAAYGYITPDDDAGNWDADLVARDTTELTQIVREAVNL